MASTLTSPFFTTDAEKKKRLSHEYSCIIEFIKRVRKKRLIFFLVFEKCILSAVECEAGRALYHLAQ